EETRADPIASQVEVSYARHQGPGATGVAATAGRGQHADGFDVRQENTFHQRFAPTRLGLVKQFFQFTLVLLWIAGMPGIELLEGRDQRAPFRRDARVERLRGEEAGTIQVLNNRITWLRQPAQGDIEAGNPRRNERVDDLIQRRVASLIYQFRGIGRVCCQNHTGGIQHAPIVQAHTLNLTVPIFDGCNTGAAHNLRARLFCRSTQSLDQRLPTILDIVDRVLERTLKLGNKDLRAHQVQGATVDKDIRG